MEAIVSELVTWRMGDLVRLEWPTTQSPFADVSGPEAFALRTLGSVGGYTVYEAKISQKLAYSYIYLFGFCRICVGGKIPLDLARCLSRSSQESVGLRR